ncbi:AraC family transcriptional regulator [Paraburkholderia bonniea]|uniref:helix-turn-helix domain-containing protein n=1 Tax=Paraburkholderia bonniea TaxID=2152891 RepID=UPI001292511C|nr:AraC family transcriptional regulator [Paraburkholderia bonniea]WJF91722.1 AraC family transcriptional regulator [Paraburkholderia bonniea]WJF95042.1 AraC family transcriptional regulator [Paraburkholderia bonniea]
MNSAAVTAPQVSLRCYDATEASDVHDFHQIVLGLDGAMAMAVEGVGQLLDSRSAWLIPAGARHEYAGLGSNRQLVLDLPAASLAIPQRLFERARVIPVNAPLGALVRDIAMLSAGLPPARPLQQPQRFNWNAAARLSAAIISDGSSIQSTAALHAGLDFARIDRWLRAHLSEPLRIADLASHCGFGLRRFHQLFIEAFGETPHRYLQRLRLDTAIILLNEPSRPLTDIALSVGFSDQSAFTHAFSRRFGLAPGQWRTGPGTD